MDRDQEKFYEDEELENSEAPQVQQNDEVNDMRYFLNCSSTSVRRSTRAPTCR